MNEQQKHAADQLQNAIKAILDSGLHNVVKTIVSRGFVNGKQESFTCLIFAESDVVAEAIETRTKTPTDDEFAGFPM